MFEGSLTYKPKAHMNCDANDIHQLDNQLSFRLMDVQNFDHEVEDIFRIIQEASDYSIPMVMSFKKIGKGRSACWWNVELEELRKIVNNKRRCYQRTYNNSELRKHRKTTYYTLRKKYKDLLMKCKKDSWRDYCNNISKT